MSHPRTTDPRRPDPALPDDFADRVISRLCRTELGVALWRAAVGEETAELYRERIEALERQKTPNAG